MSNRKIIGFNDEIEFELIDNQIRVIDNGPLYKNKLKNGLFLDTLCAMDIQCKDVICEQLIENVKEIECIKINYDTIETDDTIETNYEKIQSNRRQMNKNKKNKMINKREKKRREKRKMLKVGNDYKMNLYNDYDKKVFSKVSIPTNHFGKKEIDKYAPLCTDCFVFAMLSKRYYMLYKCSYNKIYCEHFKCWICKDEESFICNEIKYCCVECYNNISKSKYIKKYSRSCNCCEEYGYDYGKKYKCGTYFGFDFNTHINYDHHLDQNGNMIIEIKDANINFEPNYELTNDYDDLSDSTESYNYDYDFYDL